MLETVTRKLPTPENPLNFLIAPHAHYFNSSERLANEIFFDDNFQYSWRDPTAVEWYWSLSALIQLPLSDVKYRPTYLISRHFTVMPTWLWFVSWFLFRILITKPYGRRGEQLARIKQSVETNQVVCKLKCKNWNGLSLFILCFLWPSLTTSKVGFKNSTTLHSPYGYGAVTLGFVHCYESINLIGICSRSKSSQSAIASFRRKAEFVVGSFCVGAATGKGEGANANSVLALTYPSAQ